MRRLARWEEKHGGLPPPDDFTGRRAFDTHPERWMTAEQRAEAMQREMLARNRGEVLDASDENIGNRYPGQGEPVPASFEASPRASQGSAVPLNQSRV